MFACHWQLGLGKKKKRWNMGSLIWAVTVVYAVCVKARQARLGTYRAGDIIEMWNRVGPL